MMMMMTGRGVVGPGEAYKGEQGDLRGASTTAQRAGQGKQQGPHTG